MLAEEYHICQTASILGSYDISCFQVLEVSWLQSFWTLDLVIY